MAGKLGRSAAAAPPAATRTKFDKHIDTDAIGSVIGVTIDAGGT